MDMHEFHEQVAEVIARVGRQVIGVIDNPPFAYTIGNTLHDPPHPELLVIGTSDNRMLNALSEMVVERGRPFDHMELVDLGGKFPVRILQAGSRARREYTIQAGQHLGQEDYAIMQVLLPDQQGRFPGDPGCSHPYCIAPILTEGN